MTPKKRVVHARIKHHENLPLAACLGVGGFVTTDAKKVTCKHCLARKPKAARRTT